MIPGDDGSYHSTRDYEEKDIANYRRCVKGEPGRYDEHNRKDSRIRKVAKHSLKLRKLYVHNHELKITNLTY